MARSKPASASSSRPRSRSTPARLKCAPARSGGEIDGAIVARERLVGASQRVEDRAAIGPVLREVGLERERAVETRQRLRVAAEIAQKVRAVAVRLGEFGVAFDGAPEACRGLASADRAAHGSGRSGCGRARAGSRAAAPARQAGCLRRIGPPAPLRPRRNRGRRDCGGRPAAPLRSGPWQARACPRDAARAPPAGFASAMVEVTAVRALARSGSGRRRQSNAPGGEAQNPAARRRSGLGRGMDFACQERGPA